MYEICVESGNSREEKVGICSRSFPSSEFFSWIWATNCTAVASAAAVFFSASASLARKIARTRSPVRKYAARAPSPAPTIIPITIVVAPLMPHRAFLSSEVLCIESMCLCTGGSDKARTSPTHRCRAHGECEALHQMTPAVLQLSRLSQSSPRTQRIAETLPLRNPQSQSAFIFSMRLFLPNLFSASRLPLSIPLIMSSGVPLSR
jgi:hypothetical protein